ncbi:MAG: hypothetical protein V2A58_13925 [Planctomycetota bacterium]
MTRLTEWPVHASPVLRTARDAWGKLRRYLDCALRPGKVRAALERRRGQCRRCARCCSILFRCPFLAGNTCLIYEKRFEQCRMYPIDPRDLASVDEECGFYFER